MKLLRFGEVGKEKPGILDQAGHIRDLSEHIKDIDIDTLSEPDFFEHINKLDYSKLPLVDAHSRIGACVHRPGKIICIGFNSKLHAEQMGRPLLPGDEMMVFLKAPSAACGAYDPILYTRMMQKLDWEAELGIIIGKKGKYIPKNQAKEHILGYCCVNDLSERYWQFEKADKQYVKGKSFDTAAPIGPYLVTKDEIKDSSQLHIKLWVNGALRQDFKTSDYIANDVAIISYVSQFFTLYPGDIISMGSAPGNAMAWGSDCFLKPNDCVEVMIEGIGRQKQIVTLEK